MSRSVKDLRDLICISRLSFRPNSDSSESDDNDNENDKIALSSTADCVARKLKPSKQTEAVANLVACKFYSVKSPTKQLAYAESGIESGASSSSTSSSAEPPPSTSSLPSSAHRFDSLLERFARQQNSSASQQHCLIEWLEKCNASLTRIRSWRSRKTVVLSTPDSNASDDQQLSSGGGGDGGGADTNFLVFAEFWLHQFTAADKQRIIEMEFEILVDEFTLAFSSSQPLASSSSSKTASSSILNDNRTVIGELMRGHVLHEYPGKLVKHKRRFLDYLWTFSSADSDAMLQTRRILTDVRNFTSRDRTQIEVLLAMRSYSLISVWSAILTFFENLNLSHQTVTREGLISSRVSKSRTSSTSIAPKFDIHKTVKCIIKENFMDVFKYLTDSGKFVVSNYHDEEGRNLLHLAVSLRQLQFAKFLCLNYMNCIDVNAKSDAGNTPLHLAVFDANLEIVRFLVSPAAGANVNAANELCDGATPLHMCALYGHPDVMRILLDHGADLTIKNTHNQTSKDIAYEMENNEIIGVIEHHTSS